MFKKIFPVALIAFSVIAGLFAGERFRPADAVSGPDAAGVGDVGAQGAQLDADTTAEVAAEPDNAPSRQGQAKGGASDRAPAYFRFPSQFFVPVMHRDQLDGVMVLTLSLEMPEDQQEDVYRQEYRLRDALLRALMVHANTGGFDGNYTVEPRMNRLRRKLLETAQQASGGIVSDVLIEDMARQNAV